MIVLVTGGRKYNDLEVVFDSIARLHSEIGIDLLIHGQATGADTLAGKVCKEIGIDVVECPANWTKYNKAAGVIRNKKMLEYFPNIDLVLAFPGENGTANMISQAKEKSIDVIYAIDLTSKTL